MCYIVASKAYLCVGFVYRIFKSMTDEWEILLFRTMGNTHIHEKIWLTLKDQGVKNHEIERLTP